MSRVPLDTFAKPEQICAPIRASDSGSEKYFLFAIRNLARRASSLIGVPVDPPSANLQLSPVFSPARGEWIRNSRVRSL